MITDGSSVLGLGDCGIQSIAMPIGKLDIYVAAAGISPKRVLPAVFDVGTDNEELRNSPMCECQSGIPARDLCCINLKVSLLPPANESDQQYR